MKRRPQNAAQPVAKINVTPIIDVALVLVIILMVTAPMIAVSDLDVKLPSARTRGLEGEERVTLTLDAKGGLAVDEMSVNRAALGSVVASRLAERGEDAVLVVRADESVSYATVQELIGDARAAGARRIAIATNQRGDLRD